METDKDRYIKSIQRYIEEWADGTRLYSPSLIKELINFMPNEPPIRRPYGEDWDYELERARKSIHLDIKLAFRDKFNELAMVWHVREQMMNEPTLSEFYNQVLMSLPFYSKCHIIDETNTTPFRAGAQRTER